MMTLRKFVSSIAMLLVAGLVVVGCNENDPGTTPDPGDGPAAATQLMATSLNNTTVGLKWTASSTANVTYKVNVTQGATAVTTVDAGAATEAQVPGLTAGTIYTFEVVAVDADNEESENSPTVMWSPASRFTSDATVTGKLRIYARSVVGKGSGIVITPNGASNVSVANSRPDAELAMIHLIADVDDATDQIRIGSPSAFTDFTAVAKFRTDVQVSDAVFTTAGLDAWYRGQSLEGLFTGNNVKFFTLQNQQTGGDGVAFAMRWGATGAQKYAKVFITPDASGNLIQDEGGDKFVEINISYQDAAGVPYAKK